MSQAPDLILAIEISNPSADAAGRSGVALARSTHTGLNVLDVEPVHGSGFGSRKLGGAGLGGHDDDLMPAIDRLAKRAGVDVRADLLRVAVSAGPGGYTSVRVACAAGKMIAAAIDRPDHPVRCVRVPTASVVLESAPAGAREGMTAVALAGKGDSAWVQSFFRSEPVGEGRLITAADISSLLLLHTRTFIADRFLPDPIRRAASAVGFRIIEPIFDAAACARVAARLIPIEPAALVPIYPREPDAVTLWRTRTPKP